MDNNKLMEQAKAARLSKRAHFQSRNNGMDGQMVDDSLESMQEEGYRTLLQNIPCAAYSAFPGKTGPATFISKKWQEWTGYSPEQLYRDPEAWPKCIHPDDRASTVGAYAAACKEASPYDLEYRIAHKDTGQLRHVRDQGFVSKDKEGAVARVDGIITDITESKETERALRESEQRFRSLSEAAFEGIGFAENGVLVDANEAFVKMYHCSFEELVGKPVMELVAPEDRELVAENMRSGYEGVYEHKGIRKDGSLIDLEIRGRSVTHQGRKMRMTAIRDVTDNKRTEKAIKESEKLHRNAVEVAGAVPYYLSLDLDAYRSVGPGIEAMTGYSPEEFTPQVFHSLVQEAVLLGEMKGLSLEEAEHKVRCEGVMSWRADFRIKTRDGQERWLANAAFHARDNEGNLQGIYGILQDITDRKQAEEALRASEERHRSMIELAPDVIVVLDKRGVIVSCNSAVEKISDYTKEDIVGKHFTKLGVLGLKDIPRYVSMFAQTLKGRVPKPLEVDFVRKDGGSGTVEVRINLLRDGNIQAIATDITERKKAVRALRQSENKFRTIFETAAKLITSVNDEGILVDCNNRMKEVLGYEKEEVIGQPLAKVFHPDYLEKVYNSLKEISSTGSVQNREYKVVHKDGSTIDVRINSTALKDEGGNFVRTLCIIDDITERKQAQQRLLDDREQLKSLASQLSLTEERERRRLATVLHDQIGQTLVFSKLKLDQIRKSASSEELAEALEEVCNSIGQVIGDTRTLTFDLSSPILYELGFEAAVAEWLNDEIHKGHGIETEFEDDQQPKPLNDDIRAVLFRNVRELLVNVVKHAQADKVKVSVRRDNGNIHVSVEDDGVGFDPVEVTSMAAKRAEFGLFSVRERLEQLGGLIEINSEPGRGTRILMTAPLKLMATDNPSRASQ